MSQFYKYLAIACLTISSFTANAQCDTVSGINSVGINGTSYTISWSPVVNAIDYQYALRTDSQIPTKGNVTANTSVQLTGLLPDVTYYFCIRTMCNSAVSDWKCSSFKTTPAGTSINSVTQAKTIAYPNPVTDILNFSFTESKSHNITIVNSIGTVVGNYTLHVGTSSLNINHLSTGLYFVKLASENEVQTFKIEKR